MGWDWSPGGEEESTLRCCLNLVFNIHSFHLLISNTSPLIGLNQEAKAINMKNGKKFRPNNFLKIDHTPSPKSPLPIFTIWGLMARANSRSFRNQVQGWDHLNLWFKVPKSRLKTDHFYTRVFFSADVFPYGACIIKIKFWAKSNFLLLTMFSHIDPTLSTHKFVIDRGVL